MAVIITALPYGIYAQQNKVPPFQIMLLNGKVFKASNLPLEKNILLVYFSPECEECHEFTKSIVQRIEDLQGASIVMVTHLPVEKIKPYVQENKLYLYYNIYIGTEGSSLFVANYFSIRHFPFAVLYDKNGNLVKKYTSTEISIEDIINRLKQLD